MHSKQLEYFVKLANTGSFSAAAKDLYITAPALQQQINLLEAEVGAALFTRSSRGVKLTDAGKTFLNGAVRLIEDMNGLFLRTRGEESPEKQLRIGIRNNMPLHFIGELCIRYNAANPHVRLIFINSPARKMLDELVSGLFDVCMYSSYWQDILHTKGICCEPLMQDRTHCLFLPHDPLAKRESVTIEDLFGRTVNFTNYNSFIQNGFHLDPSDHIYLHEQPLTWFNAYQSALNGDVTLSFAGYAPYCYPLVSVPMRDANPVDIGLAYRDSSNDTVQSFLDFAKALYRA